MKTFLLFLTLMLFSVFSRGQSVRIIKWQQMEDILTQDSDTTYIVNFWATWCKPCIEELPEFEKIGAEFANKKLKVLLISMDFPKEVEHRLTPFIQKNHIKNQVLLLNEPDANSWINKVSQQWSGAIPATLILNNKRDKKTFLEQKLNYARLKQELADFL